METEKVQYSTDERDGVRTIRVLFPRNLTLATMPEAFSEYLALWEQNIPTLVLVDMAHLEVLPEEAKQALRVMLGRVAIMPNFLGSAWVTGANAAMAAELRDLFSNAGGARSVFEHERDAVEYLNERARRREQSE